MVERLFAAVKVIAVHKSPKVDPLTQTDNLKIANSDLLPCGNTPVELTWKLKLALMVIGIGGALAISALVLQFVPLGGRGTEFNSIDDVRRAMTSGPAQSSELSGEDGKPISLRAIVRPHPDDKIIYTLKPNLDIKFVRANVKTNSCGMRSPERPIAKPKNTYRIALLGDSFAFGWGVEQKESFAQVLEDTLNRISKNSPRFEVLNFGVPGYSTFQEVSLFREQGLMFQPDAVLVYFVQNDFGMPFFIRDLTGQGGILTTLKFVELGRRLLAPGEVNRQMQNIGLDPYRSLRDLDDICRTEGLKCLLTINPRKSEMSDFSKLQRLRGLSIRFAPLRESLMEYVTRNHVPEEALTLSFDPHPSPLRHNILGNVLAPYFMEAIN